MKRAFWGVALILLCSPAGAQERPYILLANDDGIDQPGIIAMYEELSKIARVIVAAPVENQSATGHGLTSGRSPIFVSSRRDEKGNEWHGITARPATCVRLALDKLVSRRPDIVVSGSNRGDNLGLVTYYSGTVGAAREAAFLGIPAIAVSVQSGQVMDYAGAARLTARLVLEYLKNPLPRHTFLNVNYPALPAGEVRGIKVVPLSTKAPIDYFVAGERPGGERFFWPAWDPIEDEEEDTDLKAILDGWAAITPLLLDATARQAMERVKGWNLEK